MEDITIILKKGALEQLDSKTYTLTRTEIEVLWQTLAEELAKGYIKHGTLLYISLVFFIDKKDSKDLQMVIDYCQLNNII